MNTEPNLPKNEQELPAKTSESGDMAHEPMSDRDRIMAEREERRLRSQKMRKKAIPALTLILSVMIVIPVVLMLILQNIPTKDTNDDFVYPQYSFHKPYDGDIMTYEKYLRRDRRIRYYDNMNGNGLMETIDENTTDPNLLFIRDYLQIVIQGDVEGYNALFNDTYFKDHEPQADFAQQMLYDITVYFYSTEGFDNGERLYSYALEYKILENNGTFRRDIGSDMMRQQFIVLRTYPSGEIEIENLVLKKYVTNTD